MTEKNPASVSGEFRTRPLKKEYDEWFRPDELYIGSLPDMQNAEVESIAGARVPIFEVGSSNFRLPMKYRRGDGREEVYEMRGTGAVSLSDRHKGINMSRIIRILYQNQTEVMDFVGIGKVLQTFLKELESDRARLKLQFAYPIWQQSLRSDLGGYQYYDVALEGTQWRDGDFRRVIHFDFVYSSACPCSTELSEHARDLRDSFTIPHSQRSKARISVALRPGRELSLEELRDLAAGALMTETQVMVKRVDEQAFAELNGAYPKFVEDAARLLYRALDEEPAIEDFQVACAHLESLHSHDAVAVIHKGVPGGFDGSGVDYGTLVC